MPSFREGENQLGNPADVVDISADLALEVVASHLGKLAEDSELKERIDWWLEEGGDEYVQTMNCPGDLSTNDSCVASSLSRRMPRSRTH